MHNLYGITHEELLLPIFNKMRQGNKHEKQMD